MIIQGKAKWAKVIGEPSWGYESKFKEWSVDVYIDAKTIDQLKAEGLGKKIKDKGNGPFITFKRKEFKADGKANEPIRVVDHRNQPWDGRKIGNGSTVNVNFVTYDFSKTEKNINILSLQVWDLVPYEGGGEFPTRDDGPDDGEDWSDEEVATAA